MGFEMLLEEFCVRENQGFEAVGCLAPIPRKWVDLFLGIGLGIAYNSYWGPRHG